MENTQTQDDFDISSFSDFAQGVLSGIPEEDRATVGRYMKDWDGNVTKKFQQIHSEYQPYKELGDLEEIQTAMYYNSMLQQDPVQFIKTVAQACEEMGISVSDIFQQNNEEGDEPQNGGYDPTIDRRFSQMEQMMGTMYQQFQSDIQRRQEDAQIAEFDNWLSHMHSQHGEFDDDWVGLQLEKGVDPEVAIQKWQSMVGNNSPRRPAPILPPTNGAVQRDQVNPGKLSTNDRKDYIMQILRANQD